MYVSCTNTVHRFRVTKVTLIGTEGCWIQTYNGGNVYPNHVVHASANTKFLPERCRFTRALNLLFFHKMFLCTASVNAKCLGFLPAWLDPGSWLVAGSLHAGCAGDDVAGPERRHVDLEDEAGPGRAPAVALLQKGTLHRRLHGR